MTDQTEPRDLAEVETRRDSVLNGLDEVIKSIEALSQFCDRPLTGKFVLNVVSKLAPDQFNKTQERVFGMECIENAHTLGGVHFAGPNSVYGKLSEDVKYVVDGYKEHIYKLFSDAVENVTTDSPYAADLYADIARLRTLGNQFESKIPVTITDFTQVVPLDNGDGDYLLVDNLSSKFKENLDYIAEYALIWDGNLWSVKGSLDIVKERLDLFKTMHKYFHRYTY